MKQAGLRHVGWRLAILVTGLVSLLMVALPAQAGLGDLLDDLLEPVENIPVVGQIVEPIVQDVVGPLVEDVVEPVAGDLVDPVVDEVVTPLVATVVTPIVEHPVAPVPDIVVAPVTETIPPVGTTTTTTYRVIESGQDEGATESAGGGLPSSGHPGAELVADSSLSSDGEVTRARATTQLKNLETALALQTTLVGTKGTAFSDPDGGHSAPENRVEAIWLHGLTNWLRSSADVFLNILALPIRLLELLARALLTAGSGLTAPLSMLLAFTALLIKDRRWGRAKV